MSHLGCQYEAPTFGAYYPDGACIDGYMWDLDSYEDGMLSSGGDIPCPWCNTSEHLYYQDFHPAGNSHQRRVALRSEVRKVQSWAEGRSTFPPGGVKAVQP